MRSLGLAVATLLVACSGDGMAADAGADADGGSPIDGGTLTPTPPASAALPVLTPCPAGWGEVGDAPAIGCAPWALADVPECEGAEVRFPGGAACDLIGSACPADGLPVGAPEDAIFVSAAAPVGGDGRREAPFARIAQALDVATRGDTIAIGVGEYDEALDVPAGVTLRGACVAETILRASTPATGRGAVTITGPDVTVQNLRIARSEQGGVWIVGEGRTVHLSDVLIEEVRIAGIDAERGAHVEGERIIVRRVRSTDAGTFGRGLTIETGASARVVDLFVDRCIEFGIISFGEGTRVELERAAIVRTEALPSGVAGAGLVAFAGGIVDGAEIVIDESTDVGAGSEGTMRLRDSVIRGTRVRPNEGDRGRGANAQLGASLHLERVSLEDNHEFGAAVSNDGASLELADVIIRRTTASRLEDPFGRAITVQNGATLLAERVLATECEEGAVSIGGVPPSEATLRDFTITDIIEDRLERIRARGITVQDASRLVAERLHIERTGEVAILAAHANTEAMITDVTISDTRPTTGGTQPSGRALLAQLGAAIRGARVHIEGSTELAIVTYAPDSLVELTDATIDGSTRVTCTSTLCAPGGHGIGSYNRGHVALERFEVRNADTCGIHAALEGTVALRQGVVRGASIGACIQGEAQTLEALQDGVRYIDNETSLQATMLPVPEPAGTL